MFVLSCISALSIVSYYLLTFLSLEWFIADVGAIFAGGIAAGIYTSNGPEGS